MHSRNTITITQPRPASAAEAPRRKTRGRKTALKLAPLLSLCIFALAVAFLSHQLAGLDFAAVLEHLRQTTATTIVLALLLTAASFVVLSGYDLLSLRQIGKGLPYRTVLSTSFQSYAFTNMIGFALLTGGSVRFRHYREAGLTPIQIASVQILCVLAYGLGAATIVGIALLVGSPVTLGMEDTVAALPGGGLLLAVAAYIAACAVFRNPVRIGRWSGRLPPPSLAVRQIALVVVDLTVAGTVLYVLLSAGVEVSYPAFLGAYFVAATVGVASNVPGGLGVFESAMVLMLPSVPDSSMLASLLAFRLIYFLLPAALAALLLITLEWRRHRRARSSEAIVRGEGSSPDS